ncbi:MAG: hypoxanthine phosphoribosyltransferase, partial [Planctomycetia bacterium]
MTEPLSELISAEAIARRLDEMAAEIRADYSGGELFVVGVLKGSFLFLADLVRRLDDGVTIDFLRVASYGAATESSGVVEIRKDLESPVAGRDVLVVEDIIDTGLTASYLDRHLRGGAPRSLRFCTLLDKPSRRRTPFRADYLGFEIPDKFVVGYGLDYNERYRNL